MKAFIPYSREERRIVLSPGVDFRRPGTIDPFDREERQVEQQRRHELGLMGLAQMAAAQQHGLQNVLGGAPLGQLSGQHAPVWPADVTPFAGRRPPWQT